MLIDRQDSDSKNRWIFLSREKEEKMLMLIEPLVGISLLAVLPPVVGAFYLAWVSGGGGGKMGKKKEQKWHCC